MSRTLPAPVNTNVAKKITRPTWLVELGYSVPLRATSGKVVSNWPSAGINFTRQGFSVRRVEENQADFKLDNDDLAIMALVQNEGAAEDITCKIYKYYETDGVLVFSGFLDGASFQRRETRFKATRIPGGEEDFPPDRYTRTEFPWMPTEATPAVVWRGTRYEFRTRR